MKMTVCFIAVQAVKRIECFFVSAERHFCCGRGVHKKCIDGGTVCINERTEKNEEENFENSQLRSCDCS